MTTRVVSLRHGSSHGPVVADYVRIDRTTKWGNPFIVGQHGNRATCIDRYREHLRDRPDLVAAARRELRGQELACWCAPLPCHGDVLAAVAEGAEP